MADPKKLNIIAYSSDDYSASSKGSTFVAYVNPASMDWGVTMNYEPVETENSPAAELAFKSAAPETLKMELWFDSTGLLYTDSSGKNVVEQVLALKDIALTYNGEIHQPNYLMLVWGDFTFKGVMTSLSVTFSMIGPDGIPLRAKASADFSSSLSYQSAMSQAKKSSPDMTHTRTVTSGSRLPNMCSDIYGNPQYYVQVARANDLNQLRALRNGSTLSFPPLSSSTSTN